MMQAHDVSRPTRRCVVGTTRTLLTACLTALLLAGCGSPADDQKPTGGTEAVALPSAGAVDLPLPAAPGSAEPNLVSGDNGRLYMSWIEPQGDDDALRFVVLQDNGGWSKPQTIASGPDWFVNWADFPSLAARADGSLAAHWRVKSAASTYAYDVVLAVSQNGGATWSDPVRPHQDGTPTEHGFASIIGHEDGFFLTWLDGRRMEDDPPGPMTLRAAQVALDGSVESSWILDDSVCDCCPTDVVRTQTGPRVAYRDRAPGEIRDISTVQGTPGDTETPMSVHADGWLTAGCPVNGPAMDVDGDISDNVAIAWYTAAEGLPGTVLLAFSQDGGRTFDTPRQVDGGNPLGRVDIVYLDDGDVLVSWIEQREDGATIQIRRASQGTLEPQARIVAETSVSRQSGFPKLAHHDGQVFVTWTEAGDPTSVRTASLAL